jgi:hypothetical protein
MIEGYEKSATIVQCLLKYWTKALNECDGPDACLRLRSVFAEGEGAIDVRDDAFGHIITATDFDDYEAKWEAATVGIDTMKFRIVGEPTVKIEGDRADISFELAGEGTLDSGAPVDPAPRWRGAHRWLKIDGEWRIVRERLAAI